MSVTTYQSDCRRMTAYITARIPEEGCRIVLARGEAGEVWADVSPVRYPDGELDLHWETNCGEAVGICEIYDHLRRQEMTVEEWQAETWRPPSPVQHQRDRAVVPSRGRESAVPSQQTIGQRPSDDGVPEFLSLVEAAKLLPGRRPGKRISVGTLWRWCQRGLQNGVRLRSVLVGGQRCTRREWLEDFIKALSEAAPEPDGRPIKLRTPEQRRRASERAAEELEAAWAKRKCRPD